MPITREERAYRLSWARKRRRLHQAAVAARVGVSSNTVSRWELGQREVGVELLLKLAELYQVPVSWLLGETHHLPDPEPASDGRE